MYKNLDIMAKHDLALLPDLGLSPGGRTRTEWCWLCPSLRFLLPDFSLPNSHVPVKIKEKHQDRGLEEEGLLGLQQNGELRAGAGTGRKEFSR